jgi:hypothetical protein
LDLKKRSEKDFCGGRKKEKRDKSQFIETSFESTNQTLGPASSGLKFKFLAAGNTSVLLFCLENPIIFHIIRTGRRKEQS